MATMMCDVMRALLVAVGRAEGPWMARRRSSIGSGGSGRATRRHGARAGEEDDMRACGRWRH